MKKNGAYTAIGEDTFLVCSYGKTPGKSMKALGKLIDKYLEEDETVLVLGLSGNYDEDGVFCMNATLSHWG